MASLVPEISPIQTNMSPLIQLDQQSITEALQAAINSIRAQPTPPRLHQLLAPPCQTIHVAYLRRRNKPPKNFV